MAADTQQHISLSLAAQRLGVSWAVAWRLLLQGKLRGHKVRGRWFIDPISVRDFDEEATDPYTAKT